MNYISPCINIIVQDKQQFSVYDAYIGAVGREIIVTPFSASLIGLDPYRSRLKTDDCRYDVISSDVLIRNG